MIRYKTFSLKFSVPFFMHQSLVSCSKFLSWFVKQVRQIKFKGWALKTWFELIVFR